MFYLFNWYRKNTSNADLVIIGLKQEMAVWMINEYQQRLTNGEEFNTFECYNDFLEGHKITFISVDKKYYDEYFGWGLWYNKSDNFKMLQLVFPNTSGLWPLNEQASEYFLQLQPLLSEIS